MATFSRFFIIQGMFYALFKKIRLILSYLGDNLSTNIILKEIKNGNSNI